MKKERGFGSVLAVSVAATLFGVAWYLEPAFGGLRMDALGIPRTGVAFPSPVFLVLKLLLALLGTFLVARVAARLGITGFVGGARVGAMLGLLGMTLAFDSAQAGQPMSLILTDGLFMIAAAALIGALVVGARRAGRDGE